MERSLAPSPWITSTTGSRSAIQSFREYDLVEIDPKLAADLNTLPDRTRLDAVDVPGLTDQGSNMTQLPLQVLAASLVMSAAACGWTGGGPSDSPPTATVTITQSEPQHSHPSDQPSGHNQGGSDTFEMPNEVGNNLQAAQDAVQAASGNPLYFSSSEDATGQSRFQILDADWQVCSQDPAPGSTVQQGADVTFFVVRLTENCP